MWIKVCLNIEYVKPCQWHVFSVMSNNKKGEGESECEKKKMKEWSISSALVDGDAWVYMRTNARYSRSNNANEKDKRKYNVKMCAQLNRVHRYTHTNQFDKHLVCINTNRRVAPRVRGRRDENNMNRNHITAFNRMALNIILAKDSSESSPFIKRWMCVRVCMCCVILWQMPIISSVNSFTLIHSRLVLTVFASLLPLLFRFQTIMKYFCNRWQYNWKHTRTLTKFNV